MRIAILVAILLFLAIPAARAEQPYGPLLRVRIYGAPPVSDIPLRLPGPDKSGQSLPADLVALQQQAGSAASWRRLADESVRRGYYAEAARAYRREADIYRRLGDPNAARVEELKAARWDSDVALYAWRPATARDARRNDTGARLEPALGTYVGAFIDRDDYIPRYEAEGQRYGDVRVFGRKTGKPHASFFMYRAYGERFPTRWVAYLKRNGAIPHIAWEPKRLSDIRNDAYLRGWVNAAKKADTPMFIRFAGEMNGEWTRYHGNPAAYRQAFRTVYRAFRAAPRVAVIWCPNTVPQDGLDAYYPGDDATDWVGVNMYSVLYFDNDRSRPAEHVHPTDLLDYVYRRYAKRKPIAIGEYAATHESKVGRRRREDFAVTKIAELYGSLPTRYPRVKMVNWYDCNNLVHARPGRQLNNYLLTDLAGVLASYAAAIEPGWFLGARDGASPLVAEALGPRSSVLRDPVIEVWARTYVPRPRVYLRVDGRLVHATRDRYRMRVQLEGLAPGAHSLQALVYDDAGRLADSTSVDVRVP